MKQILGLHIDTESIGWALVRQSTSPSIMNLGKYMIWMPMIKHIQII